MRPHRRNYNTALNGQDNIIFMFPLISRQNKIIATWKFKHKFLSKWGVTKIGCLCHPEISCKLHNTFVTLEKHNDISKLNTDYGTTLTKVTHHPVDIQSIFRHVESTSKLPAGSRLRKAAAPSKNAVSAFQIHANYFLLPGKIPEEISRRSILFHN